MNCSGRKEEVINIIDYKKVNINTYNRSASDLAKYFRGIGSRLKDINLALKLAGSPEQVRIVEIGCGDGRDAKEIIKRSGYFVGFDPSVELIKLAKKHVPQANFKIDNALSFKYPPELDVVFAFASLLHSDKEEIKLVLKKVHSSLKPGGIFYISLKYAPRYQKFIKRDKYGERLFFLYSPEEIQQLAGDNYQTANLSHSVIGTTKWFEIALQRK